MARAFASVSGELVAPESCFGDEGEQHATVTDPEEDVPSRFLGDNAQAQYIPVELLGPIEIVHVDRSFNDRLDLVHCQPPCIGFSARGEQWARL